jgi:hypothetical protein
MERFRLGSNCTRLIVSILVFLLVLSCGTTARPDGAARRHHLADGCLAGNRQSYSPPHSHRCH